MNSLLQLFNAAHSKKSLANDLLTESRLYQTFYYLVTEYPAHNNKHSTEADEQLRITINFFENNYDDPNCTITELCRHLELSRSYVYNLFKKNTGLSPQQFLTKLRMEQAKEFLANSDYTIQNISKAVGYNDEFTFSKSFKRYLGVSPKIYRESLEQ